MKQEAGKRTLLYQGKKYQEIPTNILRNTYSNRKSKHSKEIY